MAPGRGPFVRRAIFDIRTRDEIVVDTNVGGRSTFRNAGSTARHGAEVSYAALERYGARDGRAHRARGEVRQRQASSRNAERSAFAELVYTPRVPLAGFHSAIEVVHVGRIFVNDANDDFAPAATLLNLRAGFRERIGMIKVEPLLRLDNATNRRYAGSVIVNEANSRFFEPAPIRNWLVSVTARYRF